MVDWDGTTFSGETGGSDNDISDDDGDGISGESDDDDDSSNNSPPPSSNPGAGVTGGGGTSGITDDGDGGSSSGGGGSGGGGSSGNGIGADDSGPSTPDPPSADGDDNPFAGGDSGGSGGGSGSDSGGGSDVPPGNTPDSGNIPGGDSGSDDDDSNNSPPPSSNPGAGVTGGGGTSGTSGAGDDGGSSGIGHGGLAEVARDFASGDATKDALEGAKDAVGIGDDNDDPPVGNTPGSGNIPGGESGGGSSGSDSNNDVGAGPIDGGLGGLAEVARDFASGDATKDALEGAQEAVDAGEDAVGGAVDGGKDAVGGAVDAGEDAVGGAVDEGKDAVGGAVDAGEDAVGGAVDEGKEAVGGAVSEGKDAVGGAVDAGEDVVGGAVDAGEDAVNAGADAVGVGGGSSGGGSPAPPSTGGSSSSGSGGSGGSSPPAAPPSTGGGSSNSDSSGSSGGSGSDVPPGNTPGSGNIPGGQSGGGRDPEDIADGPASVGAPEQTPAQGIEETASGEKQETAQTVQDEYLTRLEEETGREFSAEDVRVATEERDGQMVAVPELTESGEDQLQYERNQRQLDTRRDALAQIDDQTEADLTAGDDVVFDDGRVQLTEQGELREAAAQTDGVSVDDLGIVDGEIVRTTEPESVGVNPGGSGDETTVQNPPAGNTPDSGNLPSQDGVPPELVEDDPSDIPSDPFLSRDTRAGIRGTANEVFNSLTGTDDPDQQIQDQLTAGPGIADAQEEQEIAERAKGYQEYFGVSDEAESLAESATGSQKAGQAAAGLGRLPGEAAAAPSGLTLVADKGVETASNFGSVASEEGVVDTSETVINTVSSVTREQVERTRQNPIREGAALVGGIAAGTAATRAAGRSTQAARNINVRRKADATVEFRDITSEKGAAGDPPEFETDPDAPTQEAVSEVRERAADQPIEIKNAGDINTASGEIGYRLGRAVGDRTPDVDVPTSDVSVPEPDISRTIGRATGKVTGRLPDPPSGDTLNDAVRRAAGGSDSGRSPSIGGGKTPDTGSNSGGGSPAVGGEGKIPDGGDGGGNPVTGGEGKIPDPGGSGGGSSGAGSITDPVTGAVDDIGRRAEAAGESAGERAGSVVNKASEKADAAKQRAADAASPVTDPLGDAAGAAKERAAEKGAAAKASASAAAGRPLNAAEEAGRRIGTAVGDAERAAGFEGIEADNSFSDGALFRSETSRLPEDVEAGQGNYELPGLFTSPDTSPLRADVGGGISLKPRLTRPSDLAPSRQRFSGFEGDRIEGMPDDAAGSGIVEGPDGDPMPDPDAAGSRFLRRDADRGTAYVRAPNDRNTELEAIFPEGSEFKRQRQFAVDLPNDEVATLDMYERPRRTPDVDSDSGSSRLGRTDSDQQPDTEPMFDYSDIREIERRSRRGDASDGQPVTPSPAFGGSGSSGGSLGSSSGGFGSGVGLGSFGGSGSGFDSGGGSTTFSSAAGTGLGSGLGGGSGGSGLGGGSGGSGLGGGSGGSGLGGGSGGSGLDSGGFDTPSPSITYDPPGGDIPSPSVPYDPPGGDTPPSTYTPGTPGGGTQPNGGTPPNTLPPETDDDLEMRPEDTGPGFDPYKFRNAVAGAGALLGWRQ